VAEAADFLLLVGLCALEFEGADNGHLAIPVEELGGGGFDFGDGSGSCGHDDESFLCGRASV
jgi:hypothetical protein